MTYLLNLAAIFAALFLVLQLQQLRAFLALPIARHDTRRVEAPEAESLDPALAELEAQLVALGFGAPIWIESTRRDGEDVLRPLSAAFPSPDGGWVRASAPASVLRPNTPTYVFAHRLADGRVAVSQPFDIYYEMVQCAALVARMATEPTVEAQWRAHVEWLRTLGSEILPLGEAELVEEITDFEDRLQRELLATGKIRRINENLATFRLPIALEILWKFRRVPKPLPDTRHVAPARMAALAIASEQASHRAPPRDVQLALFAFTAALFMAGGWLLWHDPWYALIILVVVLIHELGHFFAMRAFGYRNVHILALPLVGGVTIGQDASPSASKRAWMSLMGPLPGIIIGWVLAWFMLSGRGADIPHLVPLAIAFLTLNYLNILPIPPLDGAHVIEAMLPARWARAQTVFLGLAAIAGAALAWSFGMPLLVFLALLQLVGLKARWQAHATESVFPRLRLPSERKARLQEIFRILDGRAGPAPAPRRVAQGLRVMHRLEARPMGWPALLFTGLVYASLVVVPVGALAYVGWAKPFEAPAGVEPWRTMEARRVEWRKQAKAASLPRLVAELADADPEQPRPQPASAEAIAAAEARLGRRLPDDLRSFYEIADGLPSESIVPLSGLRELRHQDIVNTDGVGHAITVFPESGPVEIKESEAAHWWFLGGSDSTLFYLPDVDPRLPKVHVVDSWSEDPRTLASLRDYLEMQFVGNRETKYYEAEHAKQVARARQRLAKASVPELMAAWHAPGLVPRFMGLGWPGPADDDELDAAEARLGMRLPPDLRSALATHDGFPPLHLLPIAEMDKVARKSLVERAQVDAKLSRCVVVAATKPDPRNKAQVYPTLFWCPGNPGESWVETQPGKTWPSFQEWLFERTTEHAPDAG